MIRPYHPWPLYVPVSGEPGEQQVQETVQLGQGGQVVYPSHQYVDGSDQQALYAAANGQMYGLCIRSPSECLVCRVLSVQHFIVVAVCVQNLNIIKV